MNNRDLICIRIHTYIYIHFKWFDKHGCKLSFFFSLIILFVSWIYFRLKNLILVRIWWNLLLQIHKNSYDEIFLTLLTMSLYSIVKRICNVLFEIEKWNVTTFSFFIVTVIHKNDQHTFLSSFLFSFFFCSLYFRCLYMFHREQQM